MLRDIKERSGAVLQWSGVMFRSSVSARHTEMRQATSPPSACSQLVSCENCFTCTFIFAVFVGGDELRVL